MGAPISTCISSSKENTSARIADSSTWYPQPGQHISIQTSREENPAPTASRISTRTETPSNGGSCRSMEDLQEEDNRQPRMRTPRHETAAERQRHRR
uniref:C4 n=1 Tax=Ageratum yellow vein virus TaxID=44560 RepID=W5RUS9_9GEMI|nr:C4 [Ageratum yellow vein virus]